MTGRILTCACSGLPLQVVCPTHGTATVPRSWPDPTEGVSRRVLTPTSRRAQLLALLPLRDQGDPPALADVARTLGVTDHYVRAEITQLMQRGLVDRVSRGRYVRVEVAS